MQIKIENFRKSLNNWKTWTKNMPHSSWRNLAYIWLAMLARCMQNYTFVPRFIVFHHKPIIRAFL